MKTTQLRHQAGALFLVGLEATEVSALEQSWLRMMQPGGIILFKRNLAAPQQVHALWSAITATRLNEIHGDFFRCVDLEGGTVDRLRDLIAPTPAAAVVAATGNRKLFRQHGSLIGQVLAALGFNVNLAPVLDLALPASSAVMGSRAVSADPAQVALYAWEFLAGLRTHRVLGCGKHFPGLGGGRLDSHQAMPKITRTWEQMQADLAPYRNLRTQLPLVMINHAAYPRIESPAQPASLSSFWINEVLRKQVGYRGLVISDDMEMGGVLTQRSIAEACVAAIAAGTDVIEVCHRADRILEAYEAVLREAEHSAAFARRVALSAQRIRQVQRKYVQPVRRARAATPAQMEKLRTALQNFSVEVAGYSHGAQA
jgi:beta-N-acetylhexosaminidase